MILIWGLLSLIQITFLPGFLALRYFQNKHMGLLEKVTFSFALSLIINFLLVFLLTALGLYQRLFIQFIFFAELALAFWLYRSSLLVSLDSISKTFIYGVQNTITYWNNRGNKSEQNWQRSLRLFLYLSLFAGSVVALFWISKVLLSNRLTVFSVWDSVVSWNPWAVEWFHNHIPDLTRRYGQLIPANWSLTYTFIGSSQIQFFAKSIMPLFTLFILLLMTLLGIEFKSYGFFAAAILTQLMFKKFLGVHIYSGYVDTAVSFFSFAALYCLVKASRLIDKQSIRSFLSLGAVLAAGTFATKQPGLYVLAAYPVFAYFLVFRHNKLFKKDDFNRTILYPLAIALAISVPWYFYTEIAIYLGRNKTEFEWILAEVHHGRNLWERFLYAMTSLEKYLALYILSILSLPLLSRIFRWMTLFILLPYTLFWALYASYSDRNLALALPLLALVAGIGLERFIETVQSYLAQRNFRKFPILLVGIFVLILGLISSLLVPDSKLINSQITQQKEILTNGLNKELYNYFDSTGDYGPILTDYPLVFLPGFENLALDDSFNEYATYLRHRQEHPEIEYLLMPKTANEEIFSEVMTLIETGTYQLIFDQNGYFLIKVS